MAASRKIQNTFISGEISPKALGRTDLEKYYKSVLTCENFVLMNLGGVDSRPGWRFRGYTKYEDGRNTRLKTMYSTAGDAYILEIGDMYMRFFYDGAVYGAPLEIATPWSHQDVFDLHFAQIGDILHIVNKKYPQRQMRNQGGNFFLSTTRFTPAPSEPIFVYPVSDVTPTAITGNDITFTTSVASSVILCHVTQKLSLDNGPGQAIITAITDTTNFVADIIEDFEDTSAISSGNWHLSGPFDATLTIGAGADKPVNKIVTLTATNTPFTADMVGYFIKANSGQYKITAVTSPPNNNATAQIITSPTAVGTVGSGAWTVEKTAWDTLFPATVVFHEDRLCFGGDFSFDMSRTDDFFNFASGPDDADAIRKTLASGDIVPIIQWMVSATDMLIGTDINEMRVSSNQNGFVSPSTSHPHPMTSKGSAPIQAIKNDSAVVFVEVGGNRIREIQFDIQSGAHVSRDLTFLAEHIPKGGIAQMVKQKAPHEMFWFINGEKQLCALKLDYLEQILGWQRQVINGETLSVEVAPQFVKAGPLITRAPWDELWAVNKRVLNGTTRYCIERMDFCAIDHPKTVTEGVYCETDSAVTLNSATPVSTILATHLIGEMVYVNVDGVEQGTQTVPVTGIVTLSPPGRVIDVGLHYDATLETVPPEVPGNKVPLMGRTKRWVEAGVKLHKTASVIINGERVDKTRATEEVEIEPLTGRMTGDVSVTTLGYSKTQTVKVVRDRPIHATILAVHGTIDGGQ